MATAIVMPDIGTTVEQVKLVRWLKAVGDPVKRGEMLCEVETDKATSELESIAEGVLLKQVVPEGEDVQQGTVIAYVGAAGEVPPAGGPISSVGQTFSSATSGPSTRAASNTGGQAASGAQARVSPMVRRLAERQGVDLAKVAGTGPGGLITREDVLRAKASAGRGQSHFRYAKIGTVPSSFGDAPAEGATGGRPSRRPQQPRNPDHRPDGLDRHVGGDRNAGGS